MKEYNSPQVDIIIFDENSVYTENRVSGADPDPWGGGNPEF